MTSPRSYLSHLSHPLSIFFHCPCSGHIFHADGWNSLLTLLFAFQLLPYQLIFYTTTNSLSFSLSFSSQNSEAKFWPRWALFSIAILKTTPASGTSKQLWISLRIPLFLLKTWCNTLFLPPLWNLSLSTL